MKIESSGDVLKVSLVNELAAANASEFRDRLRAELEEVHRIIEIDLSQAQYLDSSGLGALLSLHKTMRDREGSVRLVYPTPNIRKILELTRLHRLFEIRCS